MTAVHVHVPKPDQSDFGQRPMVGTHNLQHHELFSDEALIDLLDRFPRQHLYAWATGRDASRPQENQLAANADASGAELLRAVRAGRFWLNVTRIDRADARYRALIDEIYGQLTATVPGFVPLASQGALLISSPRAVVYYHADAPANMLWHVRGHKRVWIYPDLDERYMQQSVLEDIFAGVRHEYLPYESSFDAAATVYDLEPGQWTTWPQNAPHRVTNLDDLNVSLSTEHYTVASRRRERVYLANRFLRARLHVRNPSPRETGAVAALKTIFHRVANRLGFDPLQYKRYVPVLRVDPDAADAVRELTDCTPAGAR
ncbi:MAG TPA: hypothetical protein VKB34_09870 [Povalibacter sp.]|nr:hypothetical protein [Povalibacter sp.]